MRALEEEYEQTESRLQTANEKLEEATKAADESERLAIIAGVITRNHSLLSPHTSMIILECVQCYIPVVCVVGKEMKERVFI